MAGLAAGRTAEAVAKSQELNKPSRTTVIASRNGIRGVARAYELITQKQVDPLDAVIAGVNIQEARSKG